MPRRRHRHGIRLVLLVGALAGMSLLPSLARAQGSFVNFETGQVRPLALSADGTRLFAVNTPDNRLEIFTVSGSGLTHTGSVEVGLEPVAVAARSSSEVWVVNHLSDSISIVDVAATPPHVVRTLLTCDEPRDLVFAGTGSNRAFVTTARRGQNCPVAANLTTEGIGRAVVQVFDATNLGGGIGGTPIANVVLFGDTPRALARSTDGNTVYAAVFHSGNQTTALNEGLVCDGGSGAGACNVQGSSMPGGLPAPNRDSNNVVGPETGLIVKFNNTTSQWQDTLGRNWNNGVRFSLPDQDVFAINASAATPVETSNFAHVGTILFNMAVNPTNGRVYVSNTDANNAVRFEGPGAGGATTVQGHLHESRITVLNGASVLPRHLNKHINYNVRPASPATNAASLATPLGMAVTNDGATLYVTAFGSSKVGVFSTTALENNTFTPSAASHITLTGGGPTGIVLNTANTRGYVFTRFDNSISVLDLTTAQEVDHVSVYTPEPPGVLNGRRFLYDAAFTSSNGETSCSSCHIFGDFDSLGWDLGDPSGSVTSNPLPFRISGDTDFHPLKGPMTTQSLRGMANHGAMHWRGDRNGGPGAAFNEDLAFKQFNPAFVGLVGRSTELSTADMQAFTDFVLTVHYPPNPIRNLDNTLTTAQQNGRNTYFGANSDVLFNCNGCHVLNRNQGFFGSDGFATFEGETQSFKVAHLRNVYQKVGMFGMPALNGGIATGNNADQGPQVRGFGILHDGSIDTVRRFLSATVFTLSTTQEQELEQFVLAFDTELFPVVGQQVTLDSSNGGTVGPRINLMIARATQALPECDVVVKGTIAGEQRGAWLTGGTFQTDRDGDTLTDAALRALAATPGQQLTYTCVPPGSGERIGVDRDEDGAFDRDELDAGTDPTDPNSFPGAITPTSVRSTQLTLRDDDTAPINLNSRTLSFRSAKQGASPSGVVVPVWNSAGDPTTAGGATLIVYDGDGGNGVVTIPLPQAGWKRTGTITNPGYKYSDPLRVMGPINAATLRAGTLTIRGKGGALYPLSDAPQGTMAVRLTLGTETQFCAAAPAKSPTTTNDTTKRFVAVRNTAAPVSCPAVPGGGSASKAFLDAPASLWE
jgi:DNA-binding beta-propeller fold protein YncE/mono/diheme cytochrome c family protein